MCVVLCCVVLCCVVLCCVRCAVAVAQGGWLLLWGWLGWLLLLWGSQRGLSAQAGPRRVYIYKDPHPKVGAVLRYLTAALPNRRVT